MPKDPNGAMRARQRLGAPASSLLWRSGAPSAGRTPALLFLLIAALALLFALPSPTRAASLSFRIPRLDGEFTGVANLLLDSARNTHDIELRWKVTAGSPAGTPGLRVIILEAEGSGIALRARAEVDAATLDGTWRVESAHAELAELLPRLAARLPSVVSGLSAEGRGEITGGGEFRAGKFDGRAAFRLDHATVSNPARGWMIEGLALHAELASLAALSTDTAAPQTLSFTRLEAGGVEIRDARAAFALTPDGLLRLDSFRADGLGGSLALAPFTLNLARPSAAIRAEVVGIDSARLAAYLPAAVSEARGRLSGDLEFRWDPRAGLSFGDGHLSLQKTEPASIRLSPAPGFFTAKVPEKIELLGGPLRRLFTIRNPAYDTLKKIELGEMPLSVESIEAGFEPSGDEQGRTARVAIVARPTAPDSAVKVVRFNISVSGPLSEVIRFGLDDTLSFSW
ncbi:YdbH domain-containing protein [Termitidicoccus mucosus]|uniref:intermembrane phospholipid transport protein YdbH family protein n=1 Tax=Termitidicoccus mucosus TaxID=1184151 RepID=UPI00318392E2